MKVDMGPTVVANLVLNDDYARKVLPFLKTEYFNTKDEQVLFDLISSYILKYNMLPTKDSLAVDLAKSSNISDAECKAAQARIDTLAINKDNSLQWLLDETESWMQWQGIKNALMKSIAVVQGEDKKTAPGSIPKMLTEALSISFDTNIGHDFTEDWEDRYNQYHRHEDRVEFDLKRLNDITRGGLPKGTLNVFVAGTGIGKTLVMSHLAAANLSRGYNVLYITMEMGEIGDPSISQRIDANLLNTHVSELANLPKNTYANRVEVMRNKVKGKLIIKGYPTATAGANNFRFLINELRLKKNFMPDIIYVDYLNICTSSRLKQGANVGAYAYVKSIAEELRGLAQEFNVPLVTATQLNREGAKHSDAGMEHTSESWGLPMTADLFLSIYSNEQLAALNQFQFKQLKNRYSDVSQNTRFIIGVDRSRMRLYDVETAAETSNITPLSKAREKDPFEGFK